MMRPGVLFLAAFAAFFVSPAYAADEIPFPDLVCESTVTTGTGTITLGGAFTGGYVPFSSQVTDGNSVFYNIVTGTGGSRKIEVGKGVYTASGTTLTRVPFWSTDGSATALTLSGTSRVCLDVSGSYLGQGAGSGLNADQLDSLSSAAFAQLGSNSLTWGTGTFTTEVFNAGATDPTWTYATNSTTLSNSATFSTGTGTTFTTGTIELGAASDTTIARSAAGAVTIETSPVWTDANRSQTWMVAASDETTNIAAGTGKVLWRMPYAFTVTAVGCSLSVAQTAGGVVTVDLNEGAATAAGGSPVSILGTKITIDNSETSSAFAATPATITDTAIAANADMSIDIDSIGTPLAKGLKCWITGHQ